MKNILVLLFLFLVILLGCEKEDWSVDDLTGQYLGTQTSFVSGQIPEQTTEVLKTFYTENDSLLIKVFDSPRVVAMTANVTSRGYICKFAWPSDAYCVNGVDTIRHKKVLSYEGKGIFKSDSIVESGTIIYTDSIIWNREIVRIIYSSGLWSAKLARK